MPARPGRVGVGEQDRPGRRSVGWPGHAVLQVPVIELEDWIVARTRHRLDLDADIAGIDAQPAEHPRRQNDGQHIDGRTGIEECHSGAKTRAALQGSYIVRREDIDAIVEPVLMHRVVTNFAAESQGITPRKAVARLAAEI